MTEEPIIFYHDPCFDGFTAGWIARRRYPKAHMRPSEYGKTPFHPDEVAGQDVICLDFSWKRSDMTLLALEAKSLLVLDHHASAEKELAGIPGCFFDLNHSGAMLAWNHFFPKNDPPLLISYVEDRDLWRHLLPKSKEINAAIGSYPMTWQSWDRLAIADTELLSREGVAILRDQDQKVDQAVKTVRLGKFWGKTAAMVNSCLLMSEIGNALCERLGVEVGIIWYQEETGRYRYSLRASRDGVNVHDIAAYWGGGGHPKAAGFLNSTPVTFDGTG